MKILICRLYTKDGLELPGLLCEPEEKTKVAVAYVHGRGGNFYENKYPDVLAETFVKNGIAFCSLNNRGSNYITSFLRRSNGGNKYVVIGSAYEKFEDCVLDSKAHLDFLEEQGFSEIHLMAHSFGCSKAVYYLAKTKDSRVKSLILLSPADIVGAAAKQKKMLMMIMGTLSRIVKRIFGNKLLLLPKDEIWKEYPMSVNTFIDLFGNKSEAAIFNFSNPKKGFRALSQVACPIFTVIGTKDEDVLIIPIERIMNLIKANAEASPRRESFILEGAAHDFRGFEKELADILLKWLKSFS